MLRVVWFKVKMFPRFIHLSMQKIQGFFKDFSGSFFKTIYLKPCKMFELNDTGLTLWNSTKPPNAHGNLQKTRAWKHVQTRHGLCTCSSTYTCESNEKEQWEQKTRVFTHFVSIENVMPCSPKHLFSLAFTCLKSIDIFQSCSIQKLRTFKDRKPISSTFKALKSDSCNSRVFKTCTNPVFQCDRHREQEHVYSCFSLPFCETPWMSTST